MRIKEIVITSVLCLGIVLFGILFAEDSTLYIILGLGLTYLLGAFTMWKFYKNDKLSKVYFSLGSVIAFASYLFLIGLFYM